MVIVICQTDKCPNQAQAINVLGEPERVLCSGCGTWIASDDIIPDPPIIERSITE